MNARFYPTTIPPFRFEPNKGDFRIIEAEEKGEGIITLVPFKKNEIVFSFSGHVLPYQTLYTLQIERGKYLHDPYFMGKVLHSCDPNMRCDMKTFTFTALRHIGPHEYLTMDYETTEEALFRQFYCCCGSPRCRGQICGYGSRLDNAAIMSFGASQESRETLTG